MAFTKFKDSTTQRNEQTTFYDATTAVAGDPAAAFAPLAFAFLLRPHFTLARSPSMSSPFAHASAARSADERSLKLTNAHLP